MAKIKGWTGQEVMAIPSITSSVRSIGQWGINCGIVPENGASVLSQLKYTLREYTELAVAIGSLKFEGDLPSSYVEHILDEAYDACGDILVTVIQAARIAGHDPMRLSDTIESAYVLEMDNNLTLEENLQKVGDWISRLTIDAANAKALELPHAVDLGVVHGLACWLLTLFVSYPQLKGNRYILRDCLHKSYLAIKDRKGRMVDGVFVKEN